jgi:TetR/AcrR family transcriptional repressor of nem operon
MKKSKAETAKTRQRIVEVASEAIRNQGIEATGVAEVMKAAGLTHGGFYRHFASKEELVTEAIALSRKDYVAGTVAAAEQGADAMLKHLQEYVTTGYRDDIGGGCPLAANGSEIVRADAKTRHLATEGFRTIYQKTTPFMRPQDDETQTDTALSVAAQMIGALTLSRLVDDPALSEQILRVTRKRIAKALVPSTSKGQKKTARSKMD